MGSFCRRRRASLGPVTDLGIHHKLLPADLDDALGAGGGLSTGARALDARLARGGQRRRVGLGLRTHRVASAAARGAGSLFMVSVRGRLLALGPHGLTRRRAVLVLERHRIAPEAAIHDDAEAPPPLALEVHDGGDSQDQDLQGLADLAQAPAANKLLARGARLEDLVEHGKARARRLDDVRRLGLRGESSRATPEVRLPIFLILLSVDVRLQIGVAVMIWIDDGEPAP